MVLLSLLPLKGNAAGRFYPHQGHLGLTPVSLSGIVRTKPDTDAGESLSRSIQASAITVSLRCYEARLGRVGVVRTNVLFDQSITLWTPSPSAAASSSAPDAISYADLPFQDFPFSLVLPPSAGGFSTCSLQAYRVYWRIEAIIHHIPLPAVGNRHIKHYDVALSRHDHPTLHLAPSTFCTPPPSAAHLFHSATISSEQRAIAPNESFPLSISVACRPGVIPTKFSCSLKRVLDLYDDSSSSPQSQSPPPSRHGDTQLQLSSRPSSAQHGEATRRSSNPRFPRDDDHDTLVARSDDSEMEDDADGGTVVSSGDSPRSTVLSPPSYALSVAEKSVRTVLHQENGVFPKSPSSVGLAPPLPPHPANQTTPASSTSETQHDRSGSGEGCVVYAQQLRMHIPCPKSQYHWAVGETMRTGMVGLRFVVNVKIMFTSPTSGVETVKLTHEHEVLVAAVDEAERMRIMEAYRINLQMLQHSPMMMGVTSLRQSPTLTNMSAQGSASASSSEGSGRRRRRSPSPAAPPPALAELASLHPQNLLSSGKNKRPAPMIDTNVSGGSGGPLSFFDRRRRGATPPTTSPSNTRSEAVPPPPPSSSSSTTSRFSRTMRRPRTATGTPSRVAVPPPPVRTSSPPYNHHHNKPELTLETEDASGRYTRRRLSGQHPSSSYVLTSDGGNGLGFGEHRVSPQLSGFEPEQVRAWEEELERIASFSKRRSMAVGAGSGVNGGAADAGPAGAGPAGRRAPVVRLPVTGNA